MKSSMLAGKMVENNESSNIAEELNRITEIDEVEMLAAWRQTFSSMLFFLC